MAVAPGEGLDEAGDILAVAHREGCQLEGGDPTLRDRPECRHVRCRKGESHHTFQEGSSLLYGEAQLGGSDLGHLVPRAQLGEGKGWIRAAGDDEVSVPWQVLQQERGSLMDGPGVDHVVVVEDYGDLLVPYVGQLVDQSSHYRLDRGELRQTQRGQNPLADPLA